jgi:hypothetical protein
MKICGLLRPDWLKGIPGLGEIWGGCEGEDWTDIPGRAWIDSIVEIRWIESRGN